MKRVPDVQVISHQGLWILSNGFLLQDWPVFEIFPGSPVTSMTPCRPLLAIVRHLGRSAMEHVGQSLLPPSFPSLRAPSLSVERFCHKPLGFRTVAPPAQRQTMEARGNRTQRGG